MSLTVRIIAPDKTLLDCETEEIVIPSTTGQLSILSGHAPLLVALDTGVLRVRKSKYQDWQNVAIDGGFAEVDDDEVTILVDGGELGEKISFEESRVAFNHLREELSQVAAGDRQAQFQANKAFKHARARFQAAGGSV